MTARMPISSGCSSAEALDVSETGLFVETNQVLDEGELVHLQLRLGSDLELDARARVARRETMLFHKIGYGLELIDISDQDRDGIRKFVAEHSGDERRA